MTRLGEALRGQRFGEMAVWAMEVYGAVYTLQELLTVKSDDIEGRAKIYESMVKGTNVLEAATLVSFEVLMNEIRGLGLKLEMQRVRGALKGIVRVLGEVQSPIPVSGGNTEFWLHRSL